MESLEEAGRKHKDNVCNGQLKDTATLTTHEECNLEYKSSDHIRRLLTQSAASSNKIQWSGGAIIRTRWSHSAIPFDFKSDCIFSGIACDVKADDSYPSWCLKRKVMLSQTANKEKGKKSVKEVLLKIYLVKNKFSGQLWFETVFRCHL